MYRSLLALRSANNALCQQIALGKAFNRKICKYTQLCTRVMDGFQQSFCVLARHYVTTPIKQDPSVFALWSSTKELNSEQRNSVFTAIKNKFQLIQGPPGD